MNKTLKEKLEIIISDLDSCENCKSLIHYQATINELLSLFEEMGESVIGKNEEWNHKTESITGSKRILHENDLRLQQRIKLKELVGK